MGEESSAAMSPEADEEASLATELASELPITRQHACKRHWEHSVEAEIVSMPEGLVVCPAGHMLRPTVPKFYQERGHSRRCSTCRSKIKREKIRHRCAPCDFQICAACFERLHLTRAKAASDPSAARNRGSWQGPQLERTQEAVDAIQIAFARHSTGGRVQQTAAKISHALHEGLHHMASKRSSRTSDSSHRRFRALESGTSANSIEVVHQAEVSHGDSSASSSSSGIAVDDVDFSGLISNGESNGESSGSDDSGSLAVTRQKAQSVDTGLDEMQSFESLNWVPAVFLNGRGKQDPEASSGRSSIDYCLSDRGSGRASMESALLDRGRTMSIEPDFLSDRLLGTRGLRIPKAAPDMELDLELLPEGSPPENVDLRRFIRAGDILNFHGESRWGHTLLALAIPRVYEVPVVFKQDSSQEMLDSNVPVYAVKVLQSASNLFEIKVSTCILVVHPATQQVCAAKEVDYGIQLCAGRNSAPVHVEILLSPLSNDTIDFQVLRLAVEEVQRAPQDQAWSFKTAVRCYLRKAALDTKNYSTRDKKRELAERMGKRWRDRPVCSTVPPRVWQKYLLKRAHQPRDVLPATNSAGAAIRRGRESGSHLLYCGCASDADPRGRCSSGASARFSMEIFEHVVGRSRCGSTTSTSSNKIFLESVGQRGKQDELPSCLLGRVSNSCSISSDTFCGPFEGPQCTKCLETQWATPSDDEDPEVAWAEDVLRLIPVKDDRVLPVELCSVLVGTLLWQRLDFTCGPPKHRLGDTITAKAESYDAKFHTPYVRTSLMPNLRNAEGALVHLGENNFTIYCARQVARSQKMVKRFGQTVDLEGDTFLWDGKCGPSSGPQCAACQRLQDRLAA